MSIRELDSCLGRGASPLDTCGGAAPVYMLAAWLLVVECQVASCLVIITTNDDISSIERFNYLQFRFTPDLNLI